MLFGMICLLFFVFCDKCYGEEIEYSLFDDNINCIWKNVIYLLLMVVLIIIIVYYYWIVGELIVVVLFGKG